MRLLVATDAWHPQVNGVVRSLSETANALNDLGVESEFLTPHQFRTLPLPTYPEIRVALATPSAAGAYLERVRPEAIHIATEGPVGMAMRRYCLRRKLSFTTSYHTRFPEYLRARFPVPLALSYAWLRRFHGAGSATLVSTEELRRELAGRGFTRLALWSRGVDTALFRPRAESVLDLPRPIFLHVGRLAVEKNVDEFLRLDLPGSKVLVGDGPERARLQAQYPQAVFLGTRTGEDLAAIYASCDAFVFPSLTDTFGMVVLEALASGLPVAAHPVPGPLETIGRSGAGVCDADLGRAALQALSIPRELCRRRAMNYTWRRSAQEFLAQLKPIESRERASGREAAPSVAPPVPSSGA